MLDGSKMEPMASLTLKNIPTSLLQRLKEAAARNRRSLNSEVLYQLEQALERQPEDPEAMLRRIDGLRSRLGFQADEEDVRRARLAGRP